MLEGMIDEMFKNADAQNCCFGEHNHNAGIKNYFKMRNEIYAQSRYQW